MGTMSDPHLKFDKNTDSTVIFFHPWEKHVLQRAKNIINPDHILSSEVSLMPSTALSAASPEDKP